MIRILFEIVHMWYFRVFLLLDNITGEIRPEVMKAVVFFSISKKLDPQTGPKMVIFNAEMHGGQAAPPMEDYSATHNQPNFSWFISKFISSFAGKMTEFVW